MKRLLFLSASLLCVSAMMAQKYPEPEFSNEIYYLKKDSAMLTRLEKGNSKMDTKMKAGGYGGSESGYEMDGPKSTIRVTSGTNLSFVYYTGSSGSASSNSKTDSMMRANGLDANMMYGMSEPSSAITLYKADPVKDKRHVYLMKTPGMINPFGSHKPKSSDKYTFSTKKIKDGYWELVVDKPLPKGEYIFVMSNMSMSGMDGSSLLFAFAID